MHAILDAKCLSTLLSQTVWREINMFYAEQKVIQSVHRHVSQTAAFECGPACEQLHFLGAIAHFLPTFLFFSACFIFTHLNKLNTPNLLRICFLYGTGTQFPCAQLQQVSKPQSFNLVSVGEQSAVHPLHYRTDPLRS